MLSLAISQAVARFGIVGFPKINWKSELNYAMHSTKTDPRRFSFFFYKMGTKSPQNYEVA